jgi:hypothetical protein
MACWAPAFLPERMGWVDEGLAAARDAGDAAAEAVLLTTLAVDELALGRVDRWEELSAAAVTIARRERLPYVMFTVHWVRMTLAAMRDDRAAVDAQLAGLATTSREVAVPMAEVHPPAAAMVSSLWNGTVAETVEPMLHVFEHTGEAAEAVFQMLARAGRVDDLRRLLTSSQHRPGAAPWSLVTDWCMEVEAAAAVGDVDLAREGLEALAPYADRISVAGAAACFGPVSGYLALAAATVGDRAAAAQYATAARDTATRWGWVAYVSWLDDALARLD